MFFFSCWPVFPIGRLKLNVYRCSNYPLLAARARTCSFSAVTMAQLFLSEKGTRGGHAANAGEIRSINPPKGI